MSELSFKERNWAENHLNMGYIVHEAVPGTCLGKSKATGWDPNKVNGQILFLLSCGCQVLMTPPRWEVKATGDFVDKKPANKDGAELVETKLVMRSANWNQSSGRSSWHVRKLFFFDDFSYTEKYLASFHDKVEAGAYIASYFSHPSGGATK